MLGLKVVGILKFITNRSSKSQCKYIRYLPHYVVEINYTISKIDSKKTFKTETNEKLNFSRTYHLVYQPISFIKIS